MRILQASACAACKVASRCHTAEAKEKIIDVTVDGREAFRWEKGQTVTVCTSEAMAGRALLLGFGIPLLMMLVSLVPYYIGLWFFRNRIARSISFQIES